MGIKKFFAKLMGMGSPETMERPFAKELEQKEIEEGLKELPPETLEKPLTEGEVGEALKPLKEGSERAKTEVTGEEDFPTT
jgi:hypothetical protein